MKDLRQRWGCVLLCCLVGIAGWATPYLTIKHLANDDEFIQGKINNVIQDRNGLIWFASFNGLHHYDGYEVVKYKSYPLVNNRIHRIYENANGDLWCLSSNQLYLFKTKEHRFIYVQQAFAKKTPANIVVSDIYPLSNGITWTVSKFGECFRFQDDAPLDSCERMNFLFGRNVDVRDVYLDSKGHEWLLTTSGLFCYGENRPVSDLSFNYVFECLGSLWFTSSNGKMINYKLESNRLENIEFPVKIKRIHNQKLWNDKIYSATDKGIVVTDLKSKETYVYTPQVVHSFDIDKQGRFWGVTADYSICRLFEDGGIEIFSLPEGAFFEDYRVRFKEDAQGQLWVLFWDNSEILYYDEAQHRFVRPQNAPAVERNLHGFLEDRQGNIWFRKQKGLDKITLHKTPFEVVDPAEGSEVRALMKDSQGRIWMGFRRRDIHLLDSLGSVIGYLNANGQITQTPTHTGILAYAMLNDSKGRIWIGTKDDGLYRLDPTENPNRYVVNHFEADHENPDALQHAAIYSLFEDSRGNIWIGTFGGGIHLWQEEGRFVNVKSGLGNLEDLKPESIRYLCELQPGIMIVCSREGLFTFNIRFDKPSQIRFYHNGKTGEPYSLSENDIVSACKLSNGTIYLCTASGGLNEVLSDDLLSEDIAFQVYSKKQGLASDAVLSAVEDGEGCLWLASERALTRFNTENGQAEIYDAVRFGKDVRFSETRPLSVNGYVYWGAVSGYLRLPIDKIVKSTYTPPLVFTSLEIQHEPSFHRMGQDGQIRLQPKERNITLHFAAIDYSNGTSRIRYAYQLEGIDEQWHYTSEPFVHYSNLPKGNYLFKLRSTNGNGVWTENERKIVIEVEPFFFESMWGYVTIGVGILLLLLFAFYLYWRFYLLRHRLIAEKEMTDVKLRFFTDLSHELRTPLTLIEAPVEEILEDKSLSHQSRKHLELVQKNAQRMLVMLNQILDFRKIQNHKMQLLLEPTDVAKELQRIVENFSPMAIQRNIALELHTPESPVNRLWIDRDKFEKIFYNLISNAFKYTEDGKSIVIVVWQEVDNVYISVKDEGHGISEKHLESLFKRFETILQSNLFKPSSGIGLSLVKQFVELHHGEIQVKSNLGEGSCFTVMFRVGREHFKNEQIEYCVDDEMLENNMQGFKDECISEKMEEEGGDCEEDKRPLILVVEDNDDVRSFLCSILNGRYQTIEAVNGHDGLEQCREYWPDLVLSDVMMPDVDGYALLNAIKRDADLYMIPVILLTAMTSINERIQGIELGADDYVTKPFSRSYLLAKVAALIEQRNLMKARMLESLSAEKQGEKCYSVEPEKPQITFADGKFVERAKKFIESNMDNADLTLNDFTEAMNMGRTALSNKIQALLGLSPMDFVLDMRMKRACQLLLSNQYSISEVAYKVGFNTPKYFSTIFKRTYGKTPTEYMKESTEGGEE
ncbi:MAG: response regulator [Bacteroidaceae bacterium]|nr:response regulator [Bacteroidaceae bacterium]